MKAHLLYRDRDFVLQPEEAVRYPYRDDIVPQFVPQQDALVQDLELNTLFNTMAGGNKLLFEVARQAVLTGLENDRETILYRQTVLQDCLRHHAIVKSLYEVVLNVIENQRRQWWSVTSKFPSSVLYSALQLMNLYLTALGQIRHIAAEHAAQFTSEGFRTLFAMLQAELTDNYLASITTHLKELEFRNGVLVSAELGIGNQGTNYILRKPPGRMPGWFKRLFLRQLPGYTFHIDPRDEAGGRAVGELRSRGINLVANALGQSADHVFSFLSRLLTELAFYLACVNLHRELERRGAPVCWPVPAPPGTRRHRCVGLRDVCLVLSMSGAVVGNTMEADGKQLCVITGANKGGKSTFLRGIGLAQLMMQAGMFVAAESFSADICRSLFTHYKREEDATMTSGKFDEELKRMSAIADALTPVARAGAHSLLLFNESFAATNEREGSEIARQIVRALLETHVKIFFVTHQYGFAHGLNGDATERVLFLRAERHPDGTRTFKLLPGEPLETSYGADLYRKIFDGAGND